MEPTYVTEFDGQEFQLADADTVGTSAGYADDRVLAEILHLPPFLVAGSVVSKRIIPYTQNVFPFETFPSGQYSGVVQPTGSANGAVNIFPFRAIVGSRNAPTATPADNASFPNPANSTGALANWRDVRSGLFIGTPTALTFTQALASSPAAPRWDLIYATIQVDSSTVSVTPRRLKNPSGGTISNVTVPAYLASPISIGVVTGTTSGSLPNLPSDTTGQYNFPLAYIRVPTTFSGTYTFLPQDIRPTSTNPGAACDFVDPSSGIHFSPGNGNNDANGAWQVSGVQQYVQGTSGQRPGAFLPPDWVGGVSKFFFVDAANSPPSHASTGILDNSIDWRNRIFRIMIQGGSFQFCTDPAGATATRLPACTTGSPAVDVPSVSFGNSFQADGFLISGQSTVLLVQPAQVPSMNSGSLVGAYVDPVTGYLHWYTNGTPSGDHFVLWIDASAKMANV